MSRFEVDRAQVAQASAAVQGSIASIGSEIDRMMRHLLDLQSSWQGQAAGTFQGVVGQWRATQERVRAGLEDINRALAAAGQSSAAAEADAVRLFSR